MPALLGWGWGAEFLHPGQQRALQSPSEDRDQRPRGILMYFSCSSCQLQETPEATPPQAATSPSFPSQCRSGPHLHTSPLTSRQPSALPGLPAGCPTAAVARVAKARGLDVEALFGDGGACLSHGHPRPRSCRATWEAWAPVVSCASSCPLGSSTEDISHRPQKHADLWATEQRSPTLHPPEEPPSGPQWRP